MMCTQCISKVMIQNGVVSVSRSYSLGDTFLDDEIHADQWRTCQGCALIGEFFFGVVEYSSCWLQKFIVPLKIMSQNRFLGNVGVCHTRLMSVGDFMNETLISVSVFSHAVRTMSTRLWPDHWVLSSSHFFFLPPCRLFPGIVPSIMSFSRLLCRIMFTWPKYFSFRDFIWAIGFVSWPAHLRTSSFIMCSVY